MTEQPTDQVVHRPLNPPVRPVAADPNPVQTSEAARSRPGVAGGPAGQPAVPGTAGASAEPASPPPAATGAKQAEAPKGPSDRRAGGPYRKGV